MDRSALGIDQLARFWLESAPARGVVARLQRCLAEAVARHDYPHAIKALLRQLAGAALLLASNLKQPSSIVIQAQGDGPAPLLCVEATHRLTCRAYAQIRHPSPTPSPHDLSDWVAGAGQGRLVFTIHPEQGPMYQGIVALEHASVAALLERYLSNSQQTDTRLWLREDGETLEAALLERLPATNEREAESEQARWREVEARLEQAFNQPFMPFPYEEWLAMVFPGETVRSAAAREVSFSCSCSQERAFGALRLIGHEELAPIAERDGGIDVRCEFCGQHYRIELEALRAFFRRDQLDGLHPPSTRTLQ
ncbi:MAG: Hsp33 family molecular chaperone HslO [Casimicrobiaceae bacterium]|nr:Hsp33 family molecular chaperone HslO [Casimicrobiaceae bacterium]MCX8098094.1 Hsp33 family molecular chaperone HslO [Casimicrobiaceae bacterium]MDW8311632.1 Hsp33 family molecular chaperone HslO [Burkholderiales bacterium]